MRGISITLYNREQTGVDDFNRPIYQETTETVENVLIGEPSTQDVIDELNLTGKRLAYTLAIPKGDTHEWADKRVGFFWRDIRGYRRTDTGNREPYPAQLEQKG